MATAQKVLIVGGGIGGLVAAVALRRQDIEVDVVEVNPRWDVAGVGIILISNGLRVLATLGLADRVVADGYGFSVVRMFDRDGNQVNEIPHPALAGPHLPPAAGITRPRLHAILQDAFHESGADVRTGLTVNTLQSDERGVEVRFTDGTSGRYDLVVGADGLQSLVRKLVFGPDHHPTYAGQTVWRYNVPRHPSVEGLQVHFGPTVKAGFMPLAPDLMYVFMTETPPPAPSWPRLPPESLADTFRERLAEFGGPVAEVRDQITDPAKVYYRPFEAILMPRPWHRGRVVLIGDAAHATTAHVAQGASMAMEDAVVLAEELAGQATVERALDAYMERRFERCKALVDISLELSRAEREHDRTVNVGALTGKSVAIAAQPI